MEITLEMLFWSLLGSASLVVLLQLYAIKQKQRIQQSLLLNQQVNAQQQAEAKADLEQQLTNNKQLQDQALKQLSEQVTDYFSVLKDLQHQGEQSLAEVSQKLHARLQQLSEQQNEQQTEYSEQLKQTSENLNTSTQQHALNLQDALSAHSKQLQQQQSAAQAELNQHLQNLQNLSQSADFNQQQAKLSLLEQLTSQIQSLRADNLVSLTNELAKHQDLTIENVDFVKQLGDCKVTKIKDKHSGQISHIHYQNGLKQRSDTYAGEQLKYQMHFDETSKAQQGLEFDEQGNCIFEYHYNAAGEIEQRIENRFDDNGKQIEQVAVAY